MIFRHLDDDQKQLLKADLVSKAAKMSGLALIWIKSAYFLRCDKE